MEQTGQESNAQETLEVCSNGAENSSASSSVPLLEKGILQKHQPEAKFSSPTPLKTKEPSRIKCKEEVPELPEKFLSWHLAQIKYVLPEAVQIDKILVHDEDTKCTKPELKTALLFDVIEGRYGESVFMDLSNLFSSPLKQFYITHPEDLDIPEAVLPAPFNQRSINIKVEPTSEDLSALPEMDVLNSSHLSPSFCRCFSQKTVAAEKEKTCLLSPIKSSCVANQETEGTRTFPNSSSKSAATIQVTQTSHCLSSATSGNTPMRLASAESDNLVVETSAQSTPMRSVSPNRSVLTCEDECKTATSQNSTPGNLTAKSTLPRMKMKGISVKDDTVLAKVEEGSCYIDDDHELNQEKLISHQQRSICLSDLVLLIHSVFQSVSFRSITKEELVTRLF